MFATACYMVLDVSTGRLRYANAGHPMPVHLSATRGTVESFKADSNAVGPGLAIDDEASYKSISHQIHPGDTVFMYTDGISEVANAGGHEFGQRRLVDIVSENKSLSLSELFESIYDAAREFGGSKTIEDDVCLVGFRLV